MRTTSIINRFLIVAATACLLSFAASADTLHLKNGDTLHGQYSGGSDDSIRFIINGETRVFHLDEVTSLHFGNDDNAPSQNAAPAVSQGAAQQDVPPSIPPGSAPPVSNPSTTDQSAAPPPSGPPSNPQPPVDQTGAAQTVPPSNSQDAAPISSAPPVQSAPPSAAPVPQGDSITVPVGTPITIRMVDSIDSSVDQPGKRFHATLDQDLVVNGVVVAPKGTDSYGRLIYASQAGHIQGRAELRLELTSLMMNGRARAIATGEYRLAGKSRSQQSGERIGGAAIGGAIIGGILGGGQGAAAGAAIGAGAGTAVQLSTRGDQVKIPSETLLEFKLSAPLTTIPAQPISR